MRPERRLVELMRHASYGNQVCVISENGPNTHMNVDSGIIYFRSYLTTGLRSLRVDTVWFMEYPVGAEVFKLGCDMVRLSDNPLVLRGTL